MDIEPASGTTIVDADLRARIDLAAVYRLLAHHGWGDVIFNHAAMRSPSNPRRFLIKRHELLYTEVTASNLVTRRKASRSQASSAACARYRRTRCGSITGSATMTTKASPTASTSANASSPHWAGTVRLSCGIMA